jgi:tetratricopeptide (TPR) repeat protein
MRSGVLLLLALSVSSPFTRSEADRWFRQAYQHFDKQEWEQARSAALKSLQLDPRFGDAEVLLGLIASLQARPQEAEQHLRRAIELQPSNYQAHAYLAAVHLQQKRLAAAEAGYQRVLTLKPGNAAALYNLGLIALLREQPERALPNFERVLRSNPADVPALLSLLETQLLLKRHADARHSAKKLETLLSPTDPRLFQVATVLAAHHEYLSAIPVLARIKNSPSAPFEAHYNLALAYFHTSQYDEAARVLQSLDGAAQRAEALNLTGQIEEKRQQPRAALQAFEKAARLEPMNEQFRFDHANQLLQQGSNVDALKAFREGSRDFTRSWKIRVGLGACLYLSGQYENAAKSLLEAVEIAPDSQIAFFLLGKAYEQAPASQKAIHEAFRHYLDKPRSDAWAHFHFGTILFLDAQSQPQPDFEPAIRYLRRAQELSAAFPEASLQLGIIFQAQGKVAESIRLFEEVVAMAPDLASAHYRLALAYQQQGLKEKAQAEFAAHEKLRLESQSQKIRSALQSVGR